MSGSDAGCTAPFIERRPRRVAVVLNPQSGNGRAERQWRRIEPRVAQMLPEYEVLRTKSPTEKIHAVRQFFSQNFKYGSFLPDSLTKVPPKYSPLGFFLTKNRVGHCEYYATATTLLLRHLDIPARYVYGWSVQEAERGSDTFIVRERHAHAWCIYWDDAQKIWVDLDTTPSEWAREEAQNASFWEPLTDRWSRAVFGFSKWRYYGGAGDWQNYFLLALLALIGLLAWRLLARQRRRRRAANETSEADRPLCPGLDSEFYQIEQQLDQLGLGRRVGEPLAEWLTRIEPLAPRPLEPLRALLTLHYRLRFDPRGLSEPERAALRSGVGLWLAEPKAA